MTGRTNRIESPIGTGTILDNNIKTKNDIVNGTLHNTLRKVGLVKYGPVILAP
ncbi:MAG: hypothetical protein LUC88_10675 [Prevotella sp.]|nr:hypothetical protein [Prevotella sp.]